MNLPWKPKKIKAQCVMVEDGRYCPFEARISIPAGRNPMGVRCYLRLCAIHANIVSKPLTGKAIEF